MNYNNNKTEITTIAWKLTLTAERNSFPISLLGNLA